MAICDFSGRTIEPGTGIKYVKKDGTVLDFANSKCLKNYVKLGRKPRKIKWTEEHRLIKEGKKA